MLHQESLCDKNQPPQQSERPVAVMRRGVPNHGECSDDQRQSPTDASRQAHAAKWYQLKNQVAWFGGIDSHAVADGEAPQHDPFALRLGLVCAPEVMRERRDVVPRVRLPGDEEFAVLELGPRCASIMGCITAPIVEDDLRADWQRRACRYAARTMHKPSAAS